MGFFDRIFGNWFFFNLLRPIARDDADDAAENGVTVLKPLANDFSFFGRRLKISEVDGQSISRGKTVELDGGGSITLGKRGKLLFDPGTDFDHLGSGETQKVTFQYTVSNGFFRRRADFEVTVVGENDAPLAAADFAEAVANTVTILTPLANDRDPDGDELRIVKVAGQNIDDGPVKLENGSTVALGDDGTLIFNPNQVFDPLTAGETAPLAFDYTISDGVAATTETVTLQVRGVDDPPVTEPDFAKVVANTVTVLTPLANDTDPDDPDGNQLQIIELDGMEFNNGVATLENGSIVELIDDGTIIFNPNGVFDPLTAGETDTLQFNYTVTDGDSAVSNTITLEVFGVDDPPVTRPDTVTIGADSIAPVKPLANDRDPEGNPLKIIRVDGQEFSNSFVELEGGVRVQLIDDDTLVLDPDSIFDLLQAGQTPPLAFTYTVSDGVQIATDTVNIIPQLDDLLDDIGVVSRLDDPPAEAF